MKTSDYLKKYDIRLKKMFGQNFLASDIYPKKIVEASQIEDEIIIEIGPGAGTLTDELIKTKNEIYAYEIDKTLERLLKERFKNKKNFHLKVMDFLDVDLSEFKGKNISYIANIPYNISSPIMEKIFIETPYFKKAILMVQKEFGERITAKSGKNYSPLSIFVQYYCDVENVLNIPKNEFIPKPKIDSTVIKLTPKNRNEDINLSKFFKFIHICFSQRRKTIKNNLKHINNIEKILEDLKIDTKTRPEQISIENFLSLFKMINK
jgi:16S rRNA (adenine1518-N6/adenine1519-N6)-dimethyltransferase